MSKIDEFKILRDKMIKQGWYNSPPIGCLTAKYMFIGIRPGRSMQSITRSNEILSPLLDKYLSLNYYFTNVVKFPNKNNEEPTDEETRRSIDMLKEEIKIVNPDKVIALGNWVYETLYKYNIEALKIPHPAYAARMGKQKEYEENFIKIFS